MRYSVRGAIPILAAALIACGACGGSSSTAPSPPSPTGALPPGGACGALGIGIVNGSSCSSTNAGVVLLNLRDADGIPSGACTGTIIAPRKILTAAHCLVGATAGVRVYLGSGPQLVAQSFTAAPGYTENDANAIDAGVVVLGEDVGRAPIPLLFSRDARVGETAILAGWGRDQNSVSSTLRAGAAVITAVGPTFLQTEFSSNASSVCAGDSGGPLLLSENGTWAIGGITSAVTNAVCNSGTNFYTNVRNPAAEAFILGVAPEAAQR